MSIAAAALLLMGTNASASLLVEVPRPESHDVAFEELKANRNREALDKLVAARAQRGEDPAVLINLGAAYSRLGYSDYAAEAYDAAIASRMRFDLETEQGVWRDSRELARLAKRDGLDFQAALAAR